MEVFEHGAKEFDVGSRWSEDLVSNRPLFDRMEAVLSLITTGMNCMAWRMPVLRAWLRIILKWTDVGIVPGILLPPGAEKISKELPGRFAQHRMYIEPASERIVDGDK